MTNIDRRTLLLGAAGSVVLAGCSDGDADADGPVIVKAEKGNIVTPEDTVVLRDKLGKALEAGDVDALMKLIDDQELSEDFRERWERRFANFQRLGFVDGQWYVGLPSGRTRNASGGLVEYGGTLVFAHRVKGCDGQQVVESFNTDFRKKSTTSPLEIVNVGQVEQYFDPSIWDVAEVDAIETQHAWIVFRLQDADQAKESAKRIEAGAERAFGIMPRPKGVDKIFYGLTWPKVDGELWGGVGLGEAEAHAYSHDFLDPAELATGQRKRASAKGLPRATGRVGLHQSAFSSGDLEGTACHEAIHVLANQWGSHGDTPTWVIEGLAKWGESRPGSGRLMTDDGARIRSAFAAFQNVALKDYDVFHRVPAAQEYSNYACAGAVFEYLARENGRDAVLETASAFYGAETRADGAKKLGISEKELLARTRRWLAS
jgi:hypothetical protein